MSNVRNAIQNDLLEMLAALVPGLSAEASSVGFEDPVLRRLSYAIRVAFRSRRSLLLRGLEHQVTLDELPWVSYQEKQLLPRQQ